MRADSAAAVLAACLPVGLCDVNNAAPRCAVNCASNIRNDKGALGLEVICGNKLMTNSLFQCLIGSCPQDEYGPAVAHVVLACSRLGMNIGPLHPVEVQHANLEKPQYLPTPSIPPAYGTPGGASQPDSDHLTLSFDISIDLKCNSGSDGLVTVSLPHPSPSTPVTSPAPHSSVPTPDAGEGEGEGESENGIGENGIGENGTGENGSGESGNATPSSPAKQTQTTAHHTATSSCPPDSASSNAHGPDDGQAPSQSTGPGEHGGPAATSTPSASPGGGTPSSPASTSPCSTASQDTGGLDPHDPNQSGDSSSSAGKPSHQTGGGDEPQASAASSAVLPAPVSPTSTSASRTCSASDDAEMSAEPTPGSQVSKTAEPATAAQPSSLPSPSAPPAATSLTKSVPASTIHPVPPSPPSSAGPAEPSGANPPEYSHAGSGESSSGKGPSGEHSSTKSPSGEQSSTKGPSSEPSSTNGPSGEQSSTKVSAHETSPPESSAEPVPQEGHSSGVQAPEYGPGSLTSPAHTSQTDALAVGKPTGKTAEPSETTLWPTAKSNRTTSTTRPAGHGGPSTTTCESGDKETVTPDAQQDESMGSVMVKIIRPGEFSAETMLMTVWQPAASAAATSTGSISNAQLAMGGNEVAESMVDSGHDAETSNFQTQSIFVLPRPSGASFSVPSNDAAAETSLPHVALVNSVSKPTPHLCIIALLIILVGGILMG
ncbi:hypothetical protein TrVFT333_001843 [Trichoderma virens FT-333]|nr:hypothetical protein TrVFT333_001843 [Trichoderma virens FT-333]